MKGNVHKILMIIFGLIVLYLIPHQIKVPLNSDVSPRAFPYTVTFLIIGITLISMIGDMIKRKRVEGESPSNMGALEENSEEKSKKIYLKVVLMFISTALWIILVPIIGFILTTIAFMATGMIIMGTKNKIQLILTPLIFSIAVYYVFAILLKVDIPEILKI